MSKIYFHSPSKEAAVSGAERYHFSTICNDLTWGLLSRYAEDDRALSRIFPRDHYAHSMTNFVTAARIALAVDTTGLRLGNKQIHPLTLSLNTALAFGGDAVKLAARIHGQCELHCWVSGQNRRWLAGVVRRGINSGFYRDDMGWDTVIELLRSDDSEPVVLSYSVCDGFPNAFAAGIGDDAFYELPADERWRMAFAGISARPGLELTPDNWADYYFGDGYTALDLIRDLEIR